MIELPDDELDKLFRKSSEELDPTYEPEDWNALSKRLDQEDGKTPAGWLRKWWPAVMLIILIPVGIVSYFLLDNPGSGKGNVVEAPVAGVKSSASDLPANAGSKKSVENVKSKDKITGSADKSEDNAPDEVNPAVNKSGNVDFESENVENKASKSQSENLETTEEKKRISSKILPRSRSESGGVFLDPNHSKGKKGDGAFSSNQNFSAKKGRLVRAKNNIKSPSSDQPRIESQSDKNSGVVVNQVGQVDKVNANVPVSTNLAPAANLDSVTGIGENRILLSASALDHLPFNKIKPLIFPAIEVKQTEIAAVSRPAGERELSPKMAIRIGYSPDLSTAGLKNFSKPGTAFSLMVEYALLRKLYFQAGLVKSEKVYNANASEYKLKPYVTQINTPDNIDGTCNMFEIPLGFRYDLTQTANSRWFLGTGFTSYYINKEKYVYNYKDYVYNQKPGWEGKTGWYLFSHINVSGGYEYRISKKLSLLAEPYVKIPMKKVGYGKVDLFTAGMWLSIRYTPVFK